MASGQPVASLLPAKPHESPTYCACVSLIAALLTTRKRNKSVVEMSDFVHLHVASGYSMRFGASTPQDLVERAAADGQPALALTDRDGLYGAVRFAMACGQAGISPILGVDLAALRAAADGA